MLFLDKANLAYLCVSSSQYFANKHFAKCELENQQPGTYLDSLEYILESFCYSTSKLFSSC